MDELTQAETADEKPTFDFSSPEDVLIGVVRDNGPFSNGDWQGWTIESCTVIYGKDGVIGAASYENSYGSFVDYTIAGMIDCPKAEGFFVVVGMMAVYHKGDGWTTDDDMDFFHEAVRPATEDEIALQ
jgi:hypothetical protein